MTVSELIVLLEACNQSHEIYVTTDSGSTILKDEDVYQCDNEVIIDISVAASGNSR